MTVLARQLALRLSRSGIPLLVPGYLVAAAVFVPLAGDVTLGASVRGMVDVGLWMAWLAACGAGVLVGGVLASTRDEVAFLVRPLPLVRWYLSRFAGAAGLLAVLVLALGVVWVGLGASLGVPLQGALGAWLLLVWVEVVLLAAVRGLAGAVVGGPVAVMATIAVWIAGHLVGPSIQAAQQGPAGLRIMASLASIVVPDLGRLDLQGELVNGLPVGSGLVMGGLAYGSAWVVAIVAATVLVLRNRDLA